MADTIFQTLAHFFHEYGYWTIFFGVMLENAGLPVPGETVLLFAGFLAYHGHLHLGRAIVTAILGATIGDSCGYLIGRVGGTALISKLRGRFLMSVRRYDRAQRLVLTHGHWAVFIGRFITGLRFLAGPFAGAFLMPYPRFLLFNFTGAVVWAATIGGVGFVFGGNWARLVRLFKEADLAILIIVAAAVVGYVVYLRRRKHAEL
ncbi:MAG TPA: DedA family protein [Terriglobia bacterium]|nr:DedA family protein [Terriglobia bacterium]